MTDRPPGGRGKRTAPIDSMGRIWYNRRKKTELRGAPPAAAISVRDGRMSMKPFKIAVIGCGGISVQAHGPSLEKYAKERENVVLAACCDVVAEKAEAYRERFGFLRAYTDMEEMMERERPDALSVLVPVAHTAQVVLRVMERGIPVLLEKPPGLYPQDTRRLIETADRMQAIHQVAFNRRFMPLMQAARQRLEGETIQFISYDMFRVGRRDRDFATTAIHAVDAVSHLAGSPYRSVRFRYTAALPDDPNVVNIFLEGVMQNGTLIRIQICTMSGIACERAAVHASGRYLSLKLPFFTGADRPASLTEYEQNRLVGERLSDEPDFISNGFWDENRVFYDTVRAGGRPTADLRSSWQSAVLADSIRRRAEFWEAGREA